MLALCTEKPKPIAQTTFRRAIKITDYRNFPPCARVSRKAVCGPETMYCLCQNHLVTLCLYPQFQHLIAAKCVYISRAHNNICGYSSVNYMSQRDLQRFWCSLCLQALKKYSVHDAGVVWAILSQCLASYQNYEKSVFTQNHIARKSEFFNITFSIFHLIACSDLL